MNKKLVIVRIIGIFFLIGSFLYNQYSFFRLFFLILGIGCIVFTITKNPMKQFFYGILFLILFFTIDICLAKYANHVPILSYEIKSSDTISTYNSLLYRVYNCNGNQVFDFLYQKNYACDTSLAEENVNSLLAHIVNNFSEYHNKFINVKGKISGIFGSSEISMQTFETLENGINGQVTFSDNITLTILSNNAFQKVEELKIYDTLNIIGRIDEIKNNGQNKEIIMKDAIIISRNNFATYEINVIKSKSCEADLKLMSKTDEYNYYSSCLDSIYINYDHENRYELSYVLTDKRMTFEMLTQNVEKQEYKEVDFYEYPDFHVIKCKNSNNVIIGNGKVKSNASYCDSFQNIEESESFIGI